MREIMKNKLLILLAIYLLLYIHCRGDAVKRSTCFNELGMSSGHIPSTAMSASSAVHAMSGPEAARPSLTSGGWCPRWHHHLDSKDPASVTTTAEWIQIDLDKLTLLTRLDLTISGSKASKRTSNVNNFTIELDYARQFDNDSQPVWKRYISNSKQTKMLVESNGLLHSLYLHPSPVVFSLRILIKPAETNSPTSKHIRILAPCVQFELIGCDFTDAMIAYWYVQLPDIADEHFDGVISEDNQIIEGGLGQLTDGILGPDNYLHNGKHEWIGWRNDSRRRTTSQYPSWFPRVTTSKPTTSQDTPITILFYFDGQRNFSYLLIHSNNFFNEGVQTFQTAVVSFGQGTDQAPVIHHERLDLEMEMARPVVIHLNNRVSQVVRLDLYFRSRWLLISEIEFDSKPVQHYGGFQVVRAERMMRRGHGSVDHTKTGAVSIATMLSLISLFTCTILMFLVALVLLALRNKTIIKSKKDDKNRSVHRKAMLHKWLKEPDHALVCKGYDLDDSDTTQERLTEKTTNDSYMYPIFQNQLSPLPSSHCSANNRTSSMLRNVVYRQRLRQHCCCDCLECASFSQQPEHYMQVGSGSPLVNAVDGGLRGNVEAVLEETASYSAIGEVASLIPNSISSSKCQWTREWLSSTCCKFDRPDISPAKRIPPQVPATYQCSCLGQHQQQQHQQEHHHHREDDCRDEVTNNRFQKSSAICCDCGSTASPDISGADALTVSNHEQCFLQRFFHGSEHLGGSQLTDLLTGWFSDCCRMNIRHPAIIKQLKVNTCQRSKALFIKEALFIRQYWNHENLLGLYHAAVECEPFGLVYETGGMELSDYIQQNEYDRSSTIGIAILHQISKALSYLYNRVHCLHRDVGIRNCTIDLLQCQVKVGDLAQLKRKYDCDYCCERDDCLPVSPTNRRIALRWMAVETIVQDQYTIKSCVWSLGMTMVELVTLKQPFHGLSNDEVRCFFRQLQANSLASSPIEQVLSISDMVTEMACSIIKACLHPDQILRPSINQLEHELFLASNDVDSEVYMAAAVNTSSEIEN